MVRRLCADPQVIVDLYINYDCDSNAPDNIYEQCVSGYLPLPRVRY